MDEWHGRRRTIAVPPPPMDIPVPGAVAPALCIVVLCIVVLCIMVPVRVAAAESKGLNAPPAGGAGGREISDALMLEARRHYNGPCADSAEDTLPACSDQCAPGSAAASSLAARIVSPNIAEHATVQHTVSPTYPPK